MCPLSRYDMDQGSSRYDSPAFIRNAPPSHELNSHDSETQAHAPVPGKPLVRSIYICIRQKSGEG